MRLKVGSLIGALFCFAATAGIAGAQTPGNAPPTCGAAEHRQFDFWIGERDVTNPADVVAGKHRLTWTPRSATEVLQLWETSSDGGATRTTAFDGTYRKVQ